MKKSIPATNNLCPQTMFLYGTYKDDGTPNFGLFCWLSYYWDSQLGVMACIGGEKLTKDRIHATKIFSANLIAEELLPLADYWGNKDGYKADKMNMSADIEKVHFKDFSPVMEPANLGIANNIDLLHRNSNKISKQNHQKCYPPVFL